MIYATSIQDYIAKWLCDVRKTGTTSLRFRKKMIQFIIDINCLNLTTFLNSVWYLPLRKSSFRASCGFKNGFNKIRFCKISWCYWDNNKWNDLWLFRKVHYNNKSFLMSWHTGSWFEYVFLLLWVWIYI